jgi:hypothetical protein
MKQLLRCLPILLAQALLAGGAPERPFRVGILGAFPLSDFKDRTSGSGVGLSAGWALWQMTPDTTLGLRLAHRSFATPTDRATVTDAGFDLCTRVRGGFYDRFAIGAARVDLPGRPATTKLAGEFGIGYRFEVPVGLEVYHARLAASEPPSATVNVAVSWYF